MHDRATLHHLRQIPTEWHRRGMTSPAEIADMVAARLSAQPVANRVMSTDPSYGDFFVDTAATAA